MPGLSFSAIRVGARRCPILVIPSNGHASERVCEFYPPVNTFAPRCPARSELESSLPFVVCLLKEFTHVPREFFPGLPQFVREDREVSLLAATMARPTPVHPRLGGCVDYWCEALRRTDSNLNRSFKAMPPNMRDNPEILSTVVRRPNIDDLCKGDTDLARCLFAALLRHTIACSHHIQVSRERRQSFHGPPKKASRTTEKA